MMQNTHRRPVEHWRRVQTKSGKKPVLINKGLSYVQYVKKRMKDADIKKLPFTKRLSPIAKEWNAAKKSRTHMAGGPVQYERYTGEFRRYKPKPGMFGHNESGIVDVDPSLVLTPTGELNMKKYIMLSPAMRKAVYPKLPSKAKETLKYARKTIIGFED